MSTDPDWWMIPMKVKMDTLKVKHMGSRKTPTGSEHHGLNVGLRHQVGQ